MLPKENLLSAGKEMEPDRINDRTTFGLGRAEKHKCFAGGYHEGLCASG